MDVTILLFIAIFSAGVGVWANAWGRNGWIWGVAALIISPLLTAVVLLIAGKTIEKKAEEQRAINYMANK